MSHLSSKTVFAAAKTVLAAARTVLATAKKTVYAAAKTVFAAETTIVAAAQTIFRGREKKHSPKYRRQRDRSVGRGRSVVVAALIVVGAALVAARMRQPSSLHSLPSAVAAIVVVTAITRWCNRLPWGIRLNCFQLLSTIVSQEHNKGFM